MPTLDFDADTAAYNAHMEHSKKHTHGLVDALKEAVPLIGALTTVAGTMELAFEGVKHVWEDWYHLMEKAKQTNEQIIGRLAGVVGAANLTPQRGAIEEGLKASTGPLDMQGKVSAFETFMQSAPGSTADQGLQAVEQAQTAAKAFGAVNVPKFMEALGGALEAGLSQADAGDMAAIVVQSGEKGLTAFNKALNKYLEIYPEESVRDPQAFKDMLKMGDSDVFGAKSIRGGLAIQQQLGSMPGALGRAAKIAQADEAIGGDIVTKAITAKGEVLNSEKFGEKAELIEQRNAAYDARHAAGQIGATEYYGAKFIDWLTDRAATEEEIRSDRDAQRSLFNYEASQHLEDISNNTAPAQGAGKFRTEAHAEKGE